MKISDWKRLVIFVGLHLLLLTACSECNEILCATGPPNFTIELVDTETGENVFTSGRYRQADIAISSTGGQTVSMTFIAENDVNFIRITLSSIVGDNELILSIGNEVSIPISLQIRESTTKCCTNYFIEDIHIAEFPFELVKESGVFRVEI